MKRLPLLIFLLALLAYTPSPAAQPPRPPEPDTRAQIEAALRDAVQKNAELALAYLIYDTGIDRLTLSPDERWAAIWINSLDPQTGAVVPTEPGLGIAVKQRGQWVVYLQSDPQWASMLASLPDSVMPPEEKQAWQQMYLLGNCNTSGIGPFGGYLLPWEEGFSVYLTRSITHHDPPDPTGSMHYAFDFAAPWQSGGSPMFELYASKAGTVKYTRWTQPNGDPTSPGNYIVLEDTTTTPTSYQLYLHMAQDSIPQALRQPGTFVLQGQFLGLADDTGMSTGNHVHFQVHTNPDSYWGCSVDVTFDDVDINGGRPRMPSEASTYPQYGSQGQSLYTSGNTVAFADTTPPLGGLFAPATGQVITQTLITLDGWALDLESPLEEAYFQVNFDGTWQKVGPSFTEVLFQYTWDVCAAAVPDGPVSVGVYARDAAGNQTTATGIVQFLKDAACNPPPPACDPAPGQAALFGQPNYQGSCVVLDPGVHIITLTQTGTLTALSGGMAALAGFAAAPGGGDVGSIRLGNGAVLSLYRELTFQGRGQTFTQDDPNLSDDWIGTRNIILALVESTTTAPITPLPAWPASGAAFPNGSSLTLTWDDAGSAAEFQARLRTSPTQTITSTWEAAAFWPLGSLTTGVYTWQVRARNPVATTAWSAAYTFTLDAAPITPSQTITAPLTEGFETTTTWRATGLWNLLNDPDAARGGDFSWWYGEPASDFANGTYDTAAPNSGSLTSPPIFIPDTGYFLRFWSWYETEGDGQWWDQRWVQISVDRGPFTNLYQMRDDPSGYWVQSPYLDLTPYAGQTVQIRFYFATLDARHNAYRGWLVDDLTIDANPPPACSPADEPNDTPANATPLSDGGQYTGEICPAGDVDYFTFTAAGGERLRVDVDAAARGSPLDPYLFLLDQDGTSIIAENDDEVPGNLTDPLLAFTLPYTGTYYLKLRAWDHPAAGGGQYVYTFTLYLDRDDPVIQSFTYTPIELDVSNPPQVITLTITASDADSGVGWVTFLYHSADWLNDDWIEIATDTDGSDGWAVGWDPAALPLEHGIGLAARVYDRAGNLAVTGIFDVFTISRLYLPVVLR